MKILGLVRCKLFSTFLTCFQATARPVSSRKLYSKLSSDTAP